jgi:transposase
MISLPSGTHIWIAAGVTDLRRGFTGLSALAQTVLEKEPYPGHVFVFRGRRGDLVKLLWWDGDGLCLFAKRLERGRFIWPQAEEEFGAAAHCRSSHQPDLGTAAVESVSGHAKGSGGGMTLPPPQRNRAHNLRIVGTISNDTESLDWEPIESKLLAAAAYVAPRRILYLRFHSGEVYRYFTFPADQYLEFLEAESKGRYFLGHIRNRFPYQKLPRS